MAGRHLELWLASCLACLLASNLSRADDKKVDEEMLRNLDFFYYMDAVESQELLENNDSIEDSTAEGSNDDGTSPQ